MRCAYCGEETKGTKEHIISSGILDLFPECYLTFDEVRNKVHKADPMIGDVCRECNNIRIKYIDSYATGFIRRYFTRKYSESDAVEVEYDYTLIQKMLLKFAYNDMRAHREDCTFFDDEMLQFLRNKDDVTPKAYVTVLCGLAVNISPVPDALFGNQKLRWCKSPILYGNSTVSYIDYTTGHVTINENCEKEEFADLAISYVFRFNSVQFVLLCWDKQSQTIEKNKIILQHQYPYLVMGPETCNAILPICTDEVNYYQFEHIHVSWDGLFEVGRMRKHASGGGYLSKEMYEQEWKIEKARIREEHLRT